MKQLYILAGANGSGKSTISKVLLPKEGIVYVNPDDIARELNPVDPLAARIAAGRETLRRIDELLSKGKSFAIESTLSGSVYIETIKRAQLLDGGNDLLLVAHGNGMTNVVVQDRYDDFMEDVCRK